MKELLEAVRAAILASSTLDYLNGAVYIAPQTDHMALLPASYICPCVVLSDGGEDVLWHNDLGKQTDLSVIISAFDYLREPETALIGETGESIVKGVLEINDDLRTLLVHNLLNITNMNEAEVSRVEQSRPFELWSQEDLAIKQTMTIKYTKFIL